MEGMTINALLGNYSRFIQKAFTLYLPFKGYGINHQSARSRGIIKWFDQLFMPLF